MRFLKKHTNRLPKSVLLFAAFLLLALSIISAYYFNAKPSIIVEQNNLSRYIHKQQKDFDLLMQDSAFMRKLVQQNESLDEFKRIAAKQYGVFLFAETLSGTNEILFWNNQKILPPAADFTLADGEYFQSLANGYYAVEKRTIKLSGISSNVIAYAMIPVLSKYDIESEYFYAHFAYSNDAIKKITIATEKTPYPIKSINGKPLFYIRHKPHLALPVDDTLTIILRLAAFIIFLFYIYFVAEEITQRKGVIKGVVFLSIILIAIRCSIYLLPNIFYFRQFQLFDPSIYAVNWLNRSLGDLLLNSLIICWVVLFAWFHIGIYKRVTHYLKGRWLMSAGILSIFLLILVTFQLADVVRSLVANSKISFYVNDFFSLSYFSVAGFIVLALLTLTYYYFTRLLFLFILPAFEKNQIFVYFILALSGLAYLTLRTGNNIVLFHLPVLAWLVVYTFLFNQQKLIINRFRITIAGILFWIFIFSVSLAAVILQENKAKEWLTRQSIAEKYDQLTDPTSERTLSIGLRYFDNRFLLNNYNRFADPELNKPLRDSIIRENISVGYTNTYNTKIYVFDSTNKGLYNKDSTSYAELNNIYTIQSKPTGIEDLFYHETSFDQFTYITKRTIENERGTLATFFIVATPKKYSSDALYPELLRQNKGVSEGSSIYSYAVYKKNFLVSAANKYPFRSSLTSDEIPKSEYTRVINGDYDELWYRPNKNKIIVVVKKQDSLIESITLFSYLFCAFIFLITLLRFIALLLKVGTNISLLKETWQISIRSQVHSTIIFVSVVSFLIIGAATISFFIARYNRNNVDKLSRTAAIMVKEMQQKLVQQDNVNDTLDMDDSISDYELQKLVDDVAGVHNVDVNVYDLDGNLQVTSNAEIYSKGVLSTKMHPEAFYHLNRLRQVQYVQEETMSSLRYLSIYAAVRDDQGMVHKYLNIPYFLSQVDLNQEISNFLVTIINLNAFIFLIAGTIALFITNKITRSFSVIGDKMKEITLGKTNEIIEWKRKDEIGELVKQYNKMVKQLEESATALAKSEREGAWREMARQVAHEIKNPLTPMKLSIQYLQKAINNNQQNVKELTTSVANTLVEQIDHLSKIAADFARFANIGYQSLEIFDLHPILEGLKDLYNANPQVNVIWHKVDEEVVMKADKTHMNRLFTNLITNAIDACSNQATCRIEINEKLEGDTILVEIKDNGEGIPEEMQPKIFTPNFTTKTSGTGLGLAMSKSIVEQTGGRIWFVTEQGVGTTFFIQLPIIE